MRLGVLYSGGKDSNFAMFHAMKEHEIACLISVISKNKESYMFHTPNISITELQASAIGLPMISVKTKGIKEEELEDLENAIANAKDKFNIQGIVTGAIESVYQSERIKKICDKLGLKCVNPLWKKDQECLLRELIEKKFKVMIVGVFAPPLDEKWLGRIIDEKTITELSELRKKHCISPSGEGGEIETIVLDAPFFRKKIEIIDSEVNFEKDSGVFVIKHAMLAAK